MWWLICLKSHRISFFSLFPAENWSRVWSLCRGVFLSNRLSDIDELLQQVWETWDKWLFDYKLAFASVTLRRLQRHPRQHSPSFSVGHLPLASLVLLIITKLAVNLDNLWMTYMHSLLFFFMYNSCSSHGIKSWSLTLKFDARMLSSKHCWRHLICSVLIKSNDQSPTFTNSWE